MSSTCSGAIAPFTRILAQPAVVADSLEDYLARRPHFADSIAEPGAVLLTTGDPAEISARARVFWPEVATFSRALA